MLIEFVRPAGAACASILAELPDWFGIPASNAAYAAKAEREGAWVATEGGRAAGLMVLEDHGLSALEIYLIAVRPDAHRLGIGRALIERACEVAAEKGRRYLSVKTQGPSVTYESYARTRAFYLGLGFDPIEEIMEIWGPENPALIMVKPL